MVKKIFTLLAAVVFAFSLNAQTADEIISTYLENIGGTENWQALKSTKMDAKMYMQGMEFPGTIMGMPPNKQKVIINVQGMEIVQAYDGETAWMINPMQGPEPQKIPAELAEQMTKQKFESEFINYKEKGHTAEYEGEEEVDGTPTFKVKFSKENGDVEYYFFDQEFYVPVMLKTSVSSGPMKGQEAMTYFSDYEEVDGLIFPLFIETKINGQTLQKVTVESVSLNPEMDEDSFLFPKKEGATEKGN